MCDTFHIALPVEMNADQRITTTRAFLWQLTDGGRATAFAAFHGGDTHNPHIHIMFFDRDEAGKRVQGMSERGSTEKMRVLWESVCNSKLEEYGYDVRIDHRTLEAQREEQLEALESPELPIADEDVDVTLAPEERWMSTLEKEYLDGLPAEERDALEPDYIEREVYLSPAERVEDALEYDTEFRRLKAIQTEIESLKEQAESARKEAERLHELASDAARNPKSPFNMLTHGLSAAELRVVCLSGHFTA